MLLRFCQLCDENHLALFHCEDCDEDFCRVLKVAHLKSKATKGHKVVEIPYDLICGVHGETYCSFDEDCNTRVCRECLSSTHQDHRCSLIEEGMLKKRADCEAKFMTNVKQLEEYDRAFKEAEICKQVLDAKYLDIKGTIRSNFQRIISAIDTRQELLLHLLEYFYSKYSTMYSAEQEHMKIITADYQVVNEELQRALTTSANIPYQDPTLISPAPVLVPPAIEGREAECNRLFSLYEGLKVKENPAEPKLLTSMSLFCDWINQAKISYLIEEEELEKIIETINHLGNVIEGDSVTEPSP